MLKKNDAYKGIKLPNLGINAQCDVCHEKGGFDVPISKKSCPDCGGKRKFLVPLNTGITIECRCDTCSKTGFTHKA